MSRGHDWPAVVERPFGALGLVGREVQIFGVLVDGTDMPVVQVTVSRIP